MYRPVSASRWARNLSCCSAARAGADVVERNQHGAGRVVAGTHDGQHVLVHPHHIAIDQLQPDGQAQQRPPRAEHHARGPLENGNLAAVFAQRAAHQHQVAHAHRRGVAGTQDAPRARVAREDGAVRGLHEDAFGQVVDGQAVAFLAVLQLAHDVGLLHRHADDVGDVVQQLHRRTPGRARLAVVDGDGADHLLVVAADRRRPAGAQAQRADQRAVAVPQRVGLDIFDHHAGIAEHGRAARPDGRADRHADQRLAQHRRQRRRYRQRDVLAVTAQQDGAHRAVVEQRFDDAAHFGQQVGQRHIARAQFEHGLFAAQQFLGARGLGGERPVVGLGFAQRLLGLLALADIARDHLDRGAPAELHGSGEDLHLHRRAVAAQQGLLDRRQARAALDHPLAALARQLHRVLVDERIQLAPDDVLRAVGAEQPHAGLVDENDDVVRHDVERVRHLPDQRLVAVVGERQGPGCGLLWSTG